MAIKIATLCLLVREGRSFSSYLILSFVDFLEHERVSLIKTTMPIFCPLNFLVIYLKAFWFLMKLSLTPKSQRLRLSFLAPSDLCRPKYFSNRSWENLPIKTHFIKHTKFNSFCDQLNCIFRLLNVCEEINWLLGLFLETLAGHYSMEVNQSSR